MIRKRPFGRTGLEVSELGYGAWGIGGTQWVDSDDPTSLAALHAAFEAGVNLVDTALAYGDGHSERVVGRALKDHKGVAVATKIPPKNRIWPASAGMPVADSFPPDYIVASCEESLRNLQVERIDLLQLHTWHDAFLDQDGWRAAFESLKRSGKVRLLGVSVSEHEPETALRAASAGFVDAMQILYNIYDPRAAGELFPLCFERGIGVLARVPFDEGGLTGAIGPDTTFEEGDFRATYFRGDRKAQVAQHARALTGLLGDEASTLPELALRFCLSHEAVSSVIPGMRRLTSVRANTEAAERGPLPPRLLKALEGHAWPRNFYQ
jgi:aryl-alcohol dehydrogenase-like predicted oxidoreductase